MPDMTHRARAEFAVCWESDGVSYKDRMYVDKVDFWRDIFPGDLGRKVAPLEENQRCVEHFSPGTLVLPHSLQKQKRLSGKKVYKNSQGQVVELHAGRFYPIDLAWKELFSFPGDNRAFRVLEETESSFLCDMNHPLAKQEIDVEVNLLGLHKPVAQRGGSLNDIAELICDNGPGMQVPLESVGRDGFGVSPFSRKNTVPSEEFYRKPRLVQHLDAVARGHVRSLYGELVHPEMRILDLMSSVESHLPGAFKESTIVGLGMNEEELAANPFLKKHVLHNLNTTPELPFAPASFDAVLCTVSLEYLSRPYEVIAEVERVLAPGGVVAIVLSDRWFPGEEIDIWSELHPFERQSFALQVLLSQHGLGDFHAQSVRGYPRPEDDAHYGKRFVADPIFAVWGRKKGR